MALPVSPIQFSGLLVQKAVVFRRRQVGGEDKKDRFGQPTRDEQQLAEYPCRCTAAQGGRQFNDRMTDVAETTHVLYLERGTDIRERDVVTVVNPNGKEFVTRAIVKLIREPVDGVTVHHLEVELNTERGST